MRSERWAAGFRTALGCCMRCAQSAAGESPPNPKVQHVHYDTGPRGTGNRRACGCCGALARNARCFRFRKISRTQDAPRTARGPMSVLPRQFNQRSFRRVVEYVRGARSVHNTAFPSAGRRPSSGRWKAGEFVQARAHRADRANIPQGIQCN